MTAPSQPKPPQLPPERQAWLAMFALSLGFFISLLDQTMITVALSQIQHGFHATVNQVTWVPAAFLLAVVVPLLFTGRLGDIYGQKKMFMLGIFLFGLGAVVAALAPSIHILIAARVFQGLGSSLQMPQTMAIINRIFDRRRRGRALGTWGIVGSLAALSGPLFGGFMVSTFGWHAVFWIHAPLAALTIFLAYKWVPVLPTTARKIDFPSVLVSFIALSSLVYAIQQGTKAQWAAWIWALIGVGIVAVVAFVRLQGSAPKRGTEPLIPLRLFGNRNYSAGIVAIIAMGFMAASVMVPVMLWLQNEQHFSAGQSGLLVTPMAVFAMVISPIAGILSDKIDPRRLATTGFTILIIGFLCAWWVMSGELNAWWLTLPISLWGIGQAFIWGSNAATTMRDVSPELMGAASGVYNTSRQIGSVVGVAAVSAVIQRESPHAMANSLLVIVIMLVVGLVSSLFLKNTLETR